jgi:mannose/cellobiose epimerase-like protein (N-acyl-D-glucosamine 2-epimerase family)
MIRSIPGARATIRASAPCFKGWWEQSEMLCILVHFTYARGRTDLAGILARSADFCNRHFIDHEYGGWFVKPFSGTDEGFHKGKVWKLDYHIVGMCHEAVTTMPEC